MEKSLGELAQAVGAKVVGDSSITIQSAATLTNAQTGQISFLANQKYANQLTTTTASAVVVKSEAQSNAALLIADDPYYAFQQIVVILHGHRKHPAPNISPKAGIADSAKTGDDCHIGDNVTISENARIGARCVIYPGVFIGPETEIGDDCIIYPNAVIFEKCKIGSRVIIQPNATVGQDGFGFATHNGEHHKIPQIGSVILEDDVEIGANCAIERGTMDDTVIGRGSKIGDAVAVGHGSKIGPGCLLVPQSGVSGSATLGHHVVVGGQVGIVGHIKVGDCAMIAAKAGVINDVPAGKQILGAPAIDAQQGKRAYAMIQYLPEMRRKIKQLEKKLEKSKDE